MGAISALRYLQERRSTGIAGLIISAPAVDIIHAPFWFYSPLVYLASLFAPRYTIENKVSLEMLTSDPEIIEFAKLDKLSVWRISIRTADFMMQTANLLKSGMSVRIDVPIYCLYGGIDGLVPVKAMKEFTSLIDAPQRTIQEWPNSKHSGKNTSF